MDNELTRRMKFNCPICRAETDIPAGGKADTLQTNFYLTAFMERQHMLPGVVCEFCDNPATVRCLDCVDNYCINCVKPHSKAKAFHGHHTVDIGDPEAKHKIVVREYCAKHKSEEVRFVCRKCEELICIDCKLTTHENHPSEVIADIAGNIRQEMQRSLNSGSIAKHSTTLSKTKSQLMSTNAALDKELKLGVEKIRRRAQRMHAEIVQVSQALDRKLRSLHGEQHHIIQASLLDTDKQLMSCSSLSNNTVQMLDSADDITMIREGRKLTQRLSE
jgi:hypothetical protein